jgi:NAD(P)-dependent dehydrogenase (short-subunit alcohol dehydrogenase family)
VSAEPFSPALRPLAGRHALVTGGARGIGAAVTRTLLLHGARVTMLGRSPSVPAAATATFGANQPPDYVQADVGDAEEVSRAFARARERSGAIDILVNNAGQGESAPFRQMEPALWRRMMSVNLDGTYHCVRAALPAMLDSRWGRVVNIASTAGLTGFGYVTAYCAAKHGVIGLTRALAVEVASRGVTVNAVCPGYTATEMFERTISNIVEKTERTREQAASDLLARSQQRRLVLPEEVANTVIWLCLPGSEAVTGQAIPITGGEVR